MPFASIKSTDPRTNLWNFREKFLRIGDFEKRCFFESAILIFFLNFFWIFFSFFPMKTSQSLLVSKDGSKFWSRHKWQHFLTQTKHFEGECMLKSYDFKRRGQASKNNPMGARAYQFSYQYTGIHQNYWFKAKNTEINKILQLCPNFRILWIPRNFSRSKIGRLLYTPQKIVG